MHIHTTSVIMFAQTHASRLMRAVARRVRTDGEADAGFTTIEKVVLTGIAIAIAVAVGAVVMTKAKGAAERLDPRLAA